MYSDGSIASMRWYNISKVWHLMTWGALFIYQNLPQLVHFSLSNSAQELAESSPVFRGVAGRWSEHLRPGDQTKWGQSGQYWEHPTSPTIHWTWTAMNSYRIAMICYDYRNVFFLQHRILAHLALYFGDCLLPQGKKLTHSFKSYLIRKRTKLDCQRQIEAHIWWCSLVFFKPCPQKES